MRIASEDIPKTVLRTKYGHVELLFVPFSLTNVPGAFMSIVNNIFHDYSSKFMMAYLDDILIYIQTWEEHISHSDLVLHRSRKNKLYAKHSKCLFGATEVEYLGFVLKAGRIAIES